MSGLFYTNLVTFLVSCINYFLRNFNQNLIDTIGIKTESERTSVIMKYVFFTSFINTGIIMLLTNADLSFSVLSFIPLRGEYTDFERNWYLDIAPSLVQSMVIMAVFPIISFFGFYGLRIAYRMMDKRCKKGGRTQKTTIK
jgi:hypothetical protein